MILKGEGEEGRRGGGGRGGRRGGKERGWKERRKGEGVEGEEGRRGGGRREGREGVEYMGTLFNAYCPFGIELTDRGWFL